MMKQSTQIFLLVMFLVKVSSLSAQSQIQGLVNEDETGEPVLFATVSLYKYGVLLTGTQTDFDGQFFFYDVTPGTYHVEVSYVGLQSQKQQIEVNQERNYSVILEMKYGYMLGCGPSITNCSFYDPVLFAHDNFTQGITVYPNRRPEGKSYVLFKNKRSAIRGRVEGADNDVSLSGELRLFKKDKLLKAQDLSKGYEFNFYSLKKGKYRIEVQAKGYEDYWSNVKLNGGEHKRMRIKLEPEIKNL